MRRLLLALLPAMSLTLSAWADGPPVTVKTLVTTDKTVLGQPLVLPKHDPQLIVSIYDIAPGARLPRHKHPFSRYAYVLAGELTIEFDGGEQRHYRTGEVVVEAVDTWHFGINMGVVPVRLLVIDQVEAGQPPTILAK
jgi:quercetin dioxygenase-like cupin family protein